MKKNPTVAVLPAVYNGVEWLTVQLASFYS